MFNINSSILTNQNTIKKRLFSWIITENRVLFLAFGIWSHLLGIFVNVSFFCFTSVKRNWPKRLKQSNPMKCQNDWWSHQIAICYFFTIYNIQTQKKIKQFRCKTFFFLHSFGLKLRIQLLCVSLFHNLMENISETNSYVLRKLFKY